MNVMCHIILFCKYIMYRYVCFYMEMDFYDLGERRHQTDNCGCLWGTYLKE